MRISRRRRLDVFFLVLGGLVVAVVTTFGSFVYNEERIERMWVGGAFDADGTAAVHEVIDYQFGNTFDRHGLLRRIPGLSTRSPIRVSSPDAPDGISSIVPFSFTDGPVPVPGIEMKVGDATKTVSGEHRYVLDYRHDGLMFGDELAWNAVGTGWEVGVEEADVDLVTPFELQNPVCQQGKNSSKEACDLEVVEPGHLRAHVTGLDAFRGMTIRATRGADLPVRPTIGEAPAAPPEQPGAGVAEPAAMALVGAVAGGLVASRMVRRAGRERVGSGAAAMSTADVAFGTPTSTSEQLVDAKDLADLATTEFAPPEGLTAPMGGVIWAEAVTQDHKVAWLIEAAIQGAVDLREESGKVVRILRTAPGDAQVQPILDRMFGGRDAIALGKYDATFASGWSELDSTLEAWSKASGMWDPAGDRRRLKVRILGGLLGLLALVLTGAGGALAGRWGEGWFPFLAVAAVGTGIGWGCLLRGWELRVRTPAGSGMWLRIESFRRFLAASESFHAEEAAKRGVLREYTAWAVAVGEIEHWKRVVEASTVIPSSSGVGYVFLASSLGSSVSSTSTAPSSSGGGGGGGGAGGGGGGGGGGSW